MSIALRRKMFKLGGRANTHNMGLTSGLTMKQGPDGEPREAKFVGGIIGALLGRGLGMSALRGIAGLTSKGLGRFSPERLTKFGQARQRFRDIIKFGPGIQPGFGATAGAGTSTSRALVPYTGATGALPAAPGAVLRGVGAAGVLGGGPLGLLSLIETDEDSSRIARAAETIGDAFVDFSPIGLGFSAGDFLFGKPGEDTRSLTEALGLSKKTPSVDTTTVPPPSPTKTKTKEELKAENDAKVQEYYELLGGKGVDKLEALGAGLTAAAAPLLEEDYGGAAAAFQAGLQPSIQRDKDLMDAAATLAVGDIQAERASDDALLKEVLATGDTEAYQRVTKALAAEDELGVGNVEGLPVKGNNKIDQKQVRRSKVYTDLTGATKGKYVAVNKDGQSLVTNNADQAVEFASS